ncbi:GlxA family transcriptional regulator [Marinigracilibium pacificum]|uniref:Helix-turn-helix domain-containing protein n=1 Tax=Marinigracilibium pacificum TaxID=2729599 RepID=A0A848IYP1_9BACT|nr:helix-turn-helix domain-containing protein [Marinigracilibium pacificum]NMM47354.1 helix-turn-helix domain-containing protein [Marinigracilibium pacificum]
MVTVSIIVPHRVVLQSVADPKYCFETVNSFLASNGKPKQFEVILVGLSNEIKAGEGAFSIHPDKSIDEVSKTDLIIIPAIFGDFDLAIEENREFIPWVVEQYENGAEIATLCVGAFLLASSGLLKGRKCSTHWGFIDLFKDRFPEVIVQNGNIITEDSRLYSSGGANFYWNLLIYLVEKYVDREMAILIAKYFAIDISRHNQMLFSIFKGQKQHKDLEVKETQQYIENNFGERFTVDDLAENVALGRRSLERRFKKCTNNTILEYIQRVKVEAAKRDFENSEKNIAEVMYDVGYTDQKAFRSTFKRFTGLTPKEYKSRYRHSIN